MVDLAEPDTVRHIAGDRRSLQGGPKGRPGQSAGALREV